MSSPSEDHVSFWSALAPEDRTALSSLGVERHFAPGTTIFHQEDRFDFVLILRSGRVMVVSHTGEGYRTVLALRDTGDLIGEMASVDGAPRSASVHAMTPVVALAVSGPRFSAFLRDRPQVTSALQRMLTGRLRESDRYRAEAGAGSVTVRLATVLIELAKRYGSIDNRGNVVIDLPLSQEDLAGLVLTSTRTVGRVLEKWRDEGWVATGRRRIVIQDVVSLEQAIHEIP
jgi:CRP/FNR family cyclic AMP-dependent transcriptional regulator